MTTEEMVAKVRSMLDNDPEATTEVVQSYLDTAADAVLAQRYPFGYAEGTAVPTRFQGEQCVLAARYFARRGGLGETQHTENGVTRHWYSSDDSEILKRIVPLAKVR